MEKKLHRMLAEAVTGTLRAVFEEGEVADRAVARVLGKHPQWGKRDRQFVAESVYEITRWKRRLEVLADSTDWWTVAGYWWKSQGYIRPEWAVWPEPEADLLQKREMELERSPRAIRLSLADGLDALGEEELGPDWEKEMMAMNQAAPVFLRINPARGTPASVSAALGLAGIEVEPVPGCPLGLKVLPGKVVSPALRRSGLFEIQDAASQQVAPFCGVIPGMKVVDACAGAGGKTLHLGALLEGKGKLLAMDIEPRKLERLQERAKVAGIPVETRVADPAGSQEMKGWADRVLVDAPCSGSGTLRRQADLKYRITRQSVTDIREVQRQILSQAAAWVKEGGKLIYSTCSIFPSENQEQAAWFSQTHPEFHFDEERIISPAASGWDGFYMARWQRLA